MYVFLIQAYLDSYDSGEFIKKITLDGGNNKTVANPEFEYSLTWSWTPTCAQAATYKMDMVNPKP